MSSDAKHSPTPWEVRENYGGLENLVFASNGQEVAACWPPNNPEPNAAYIVKCVNSHERLVEEVARLRDALAEMTAFWDAHGSAYAVQVAPVRESEEVVEAERVRVMEKAHAALREEASDGNS